MAQQNLQTQIHNSQTPTIGFASADHALAFTLWLHKSAAIAALEREIEAEADDKAALTHEAREQQSAQVQGDLLAVERDEASLVFRAWHDGLSIASRPDIAPAVLLNVTLVTLPAVEQRGSSIERAGFDLFSGGRR